MNFDLQVTPLDALVVINDLNSKGARQLDRPSIKTQLPPNYVDVNADGETSPIDVLLVINYINRGLAGGEGEGADLDDAEGDDRLDFATAPHRFGRKTSVARDRVAVDQHVDVILPELVDPWTRPLDRKWHSDETAARQNKKTREVDQAMASLQRGEFEIEFFSLPSN